MPNVSSLLLTSLGGGVHSRILESYVRINIGLTSKLQPTNYKICTSNKSLSYMMNFKVYVN